MHIRILCGCEWIITWWIRLSIPARVFLYAVSIVAKSVQGSNASRVVFRGSFKYCCTAKQVSDATLFKNHTKRYSPNQKSCQISPFFSPQTLLQTRAAFLFWFKNIPISMWPEKEDNWVQHFSNRKLWILKQTKKGREELACSLVNGKEKPKHSPSQCCHNPRDDNDPV
jgi:hypothetical protein